MACLFPEQSRSTGRQQQQRTAEDVCTILATIMAHGCNVRPYAMSRLTEGIAYRQIKWVTDWQLLEDAQRQALAQVVKAIGRLDVTQAWGKGKPPARDTAFVLDGLLYNESDLALEKHYTDTHGYTEINFAAFAMLGRRFALRIIKQDRLTVLLIGERLATFM